MHADDILSGAAAIASVVGLSRRRVYHEVYRGRLPAFRIGGTICARRGSLTTWLAACEASTRSPSPSSTVTS